MFTIVTVVPMNNGTKAIYGRPCAYDIVNTHEIVQFILYSS